MAEPLAKIHGLSLLEVLQALQSTQLGYTDRSRKVLPFCSEPVHQIQLGDSVWIKAPVKDGLQLAWKGPHLVILTTPTAVKVDQIPTWIHHTRLKPEDTGWTSQPTGDPLKLRLKETFIHPLILLCLLFLPVQTLNNEYYWEVQSTYTGAIIAN